MGNCFTGGATRGGSKDGVFTTNTPKTIESFYRKGRGLFEGGYYKHEVLEATTDGSGNVTFDYPEKPIYDEASRNKRTQYITYNLIAGAVDGQTFNIDWSKVKSIQGKTYSLRGAAKEAGLKWDSKTKRWVR